MAEIVEKEKDLTDSDKSALVKIRQFVWNHPEIIYKGVPLAMVGYASYPLLISSWYILPWIWSGYIAYSALPSGTLTYIWAGLKVYRKVTG